MTVMDWISLCTLVLTPILPIVYFYFMKPDGWNPWKDDDEL